MVHMLMRAVTARAGRTLSLQALGTAQLHVGPGQRPWTTEVALAMSCLLLLMAIREQGNAVLQVFQALAGHDAARDSLHVSALTQLLAGRMQPLHRGRAHAGLTASCVAAGWSSCCPLSAQWTRSCGSCWHQSSAQVSRGALLLQRPSLPCCAAGVCAQPCSLQQPHWWVQLTSAACGCCSAVCNLTPHMAASASPLTCYAASLGLPHTAGYTIHTVVALVHAGLVPLEAQQAVQDACASMAPVLSLEPQALLQVVDKSVPTAAGLGGG